MADDLEIERNFNQSSIANYIFLYFIKKGRPVNMNLERSE